MKDGYEIWNESVDIIPDKEIHLTAVLQLIVGSINLKSNPSNAKALIDGREVGTTPISITDLKPGTHQVEARMDGYYDWRESVEIVPGKEIELTATLQFRIGSLNINSNPSEAKILIDSREIGVTPKTITDLKPGTHNVEIMKGGYEIWNESVDIIPDKEIHLTAVLQLIVGSINLKSSPSNAKALIDGREVGTTPISITDLKTRYTLFRS